MSTSATHNAIIKVGGKDRAPMLVAGKVTYPEVLPTDDHPGRRAKTKLETYCTVGEHTKKRIDAEAEAVHIILTWIDNNIYSIVDACANAKEMWLAIERFMHDENINKQDVETNLYWAFGKITSRDGESLELYYSRFYKMINEL
nr:hypothetical protein [Tanacetum cinerariifolium]